MKFSIFASVSGSLVALVFSPFLVAKSPAKALPGQTFQQAQQMVQGSRLFQGMSIFEEDSEYFPGYYTVSRSFDGGEAVLYVLGEGNTVGSETLQFRYPNSRISFDRESENGLLLIASLWGEDIAQDYANSRYTDEIQGGLGINHYYLGERYGYRRSTHTDSYSGGSIYDFTVMDFSNWEESRSGDRFCLANPNANECLGL